MEAKEFLILNPLLYSDEEKYIWISDSWEEHWSAQHMFSYLLRNEIYIHGFATDVSSLMNLKMYNKQIYDINMLKQEKANIFFDSYHSEKRGYTKGNRARIINPAMKKANIIIWGAGITGETVYKMLLENGIRAKYFVDSNVKLTGRTKCDIPIYMPDILDEEPADITLIEALENWQQVDQIAASKYDERFHFSLNENIWDQWKHHNYIGVIDGGIGKKIYDMHHLHSFSSKRVYIYGIGNIEKKFAGYLGMMDYDFAGFLVDEDDYEKNEEYKGSPVLRVEEILYRSDYYIWIYDREKGKKLNELGLKYFKDYISGVLHDMDVFKKGEARLDVNLGHNYIVDEDYPGIMVYGEEKEQNYKIAVLGGSTSDGTAYPFMSWPELLHKKLGKSNVTIYNGGVCGYTSGQELIKLIRDILPLNPDMVIIYDGFNDYSVHEQYPFRFDYAREIFEYAKEHIADEYVKNNSDVCSGIRQQKNVLDYWLSNIRSMHAIAEERKIRFYSFAQPMLISKKEKTAQEKDMLVSWDVNTLRKWTSILLRSFMQTADIPSYMYDLSHIFDGKSNIYMDPCHVWEEGNRIIADEIMKVILPELELFSRR